MGVTETIMANKFRRSKSLSLFVMLLFTFSAMSLPACSDNDNSTTSQRVVHAMISFDDEGPVATAWVQDGDQNFVSDATISINNRLFEVILLGDGESDEDSVPIYYLELYDLKGGDSLTLLAKRSDGTVIYVPPSVRIPMPLQLVEPSADQSIIPGEAVEVRWTGGEGASYIGVLYADNSGEQQYWDVQGYDDAASIAIPSEVVLEGEGIIAASALSGDHFLFLENETAEALRSTFLIYRDDAIAITTGETVAESLNDGCPSGQKKGSSGNCCPNSPDPLLKAVLTCTIGFVAIVGAALWGARWGLDANSYPPCRVIRSGSGLNVLKSPMAYCQVYAATYSHYNWQKGCVCPTSVP